MLVSTILSVDLGAISVTSVVKKGIINRNLY